MNPLIIDESWKTSNLDVCIIRVEKAGRSYYIPGVLVQDIAFIPTYTVYAAIGLAITALGKEGLKIKEIHLLSTTGNVEFLSNHELEHIRDFIDTDIPIKFHSLGERTRVYKYSDCVNAAREKLLFGLVQEEDETLELMQQDSPRVAGTSKS